jgi:hypothetical protein
MIRVRQRSFYSACLACLYWLLPIHASPQCITGGIDTIVSKVVRNELDHAGSQGRWMYIDESMKQGAKIVARKIQTDDGLLTWVLSRNGVPLSPDEIDAQKETLRGLVSDPSLLDTNRNAMRKDYARINQLLADLPGAVQFTCMVQDGHTADVYFQPKDGVSSFDVLKRLIAGMSGSLHLDLSNMRLLAVKGSAQSDISILLGIGQIHQGSSVNLVRTEVSPGIWETTSVSMHIKGRVFLFKTIAQDTDESLSNFVRVPPGLAASAALPYIEAGSPPSQ